MKFGLNGNNRSTVQKLSLIKQVNYGRVQNLSCEKATGEENFLQTILLAPCEVLPKINFPITFD